MRKKEAFREVTSIPVYQQLKTRREQIAFLVEHLCDKKRLPVETFTHEEIGKLFNCSRQNIEKQYKKHKQGVKDPHRPCLLNHEQNEKFTTYLQDCFEKKQWLTYTEISEYIQNEFRISIKNNSLYRFLEQKLPTLGRFVTAVPIEDKRYEASTAEIDRYYENLNDLLAVVDYRFCYNLDETGEDEYVDTRKIKVFVPHSFTQEHASIPVSRSNKRFTIEQTICSDGTSLIPYLIIPRKTYEADIFKIYDPKTIVIRHQPNGFINEILFRDYFENLFLTSLQEKRNRYQYFGPALLIMDNLLCHKKVVSCRNDQNYIFLAPYNLHVLFIVAHSSDQTQPLDLGIFGNQKRYSQNVPDIHGVSKYTNLFNKAIQGMQMACTSRAIIAAFESAGITRNIGNPKNMKYLTDVKIKLQVDKSKCRAVRHYSTQETTEINQWAATRLTAEN